MRTRSTVLVLFLVAASAASPTLAQNIGMPAGARQWIHVSSNTVGTGTCCDDAVGGIGSIPFPSPNYANSTDYPSGRLIYANGDATGNRLRISVANALTSAAGVFFYNSMLDTYTISGPPGTEGTPVSARLVFRAVGALYVGTTQTNGNHLGSASAKIEVGTWNPGTDPALNETTRVTAFDTTNFTKLASIPLSNYGATMPTLNIDLLIDRTLSRTVGTPFDLALGFETTGNGAGNLSLSPAPSDSEYLVATIDWELPAGYSISSVLGWTDPNPPACVADMDDGSGVGTPDGGVGIEDLLYYLGVYDAGTSRADVDDGTGTGTPDGGVGIEDLLYYLSRYDTGC